MDDSIEMVVAQFRDEDEQEWDVASKGVHHGSCFRDLVEGFMDCGFVVWLIGADTVAARAVVGIWICWRCGLWLGISNTAAAGYGRSR